jgi:hypothetical protein
MFGADIQHMHGAPEQSVVSSGWCPVLFSKRPGLRQSRKAGNFPTIDSAPSGAYTRIGSVDMHPSQAPNSDARHPTKPLRWNPSARARTRLSSAILARDYVRLRKILVDI